MKVEGRKECMNDNSDIEVEEVASDEEQSSEELNKDDVQETDESLEEDTSDEGAELTEKGTKLDPNPQSAVHQQLANANRRIQQMETVMGDPKMLADYARQSGLTVAEAKAEIAEEKKEEIQEFTPENLQTAGDVAKALNAMQANNQALAEENKQLRSGYEGITRSTQAQRVASTMERDITSVREKYSELDPKSPDYDKALETEIGELFSELDYDQQSGSYRGSVSLAKVTDRVMRAAGKAKKQGSKQAQTDVRVKKAGKVVTSSKGKASKSESKDPSTAIAEKIQKALGN